MNAISKATSRRRLMGVLLAACLCGGSATAFAQTYPVRPVSIVVGAPPGQSSDLLARLLGARLATALGQAVVIDNRPGAGASLGPAHVAKSAPDGYTLLLSTPGPMAIRPNIYGTAAYDPVKSFEPIVTLGSAPLVLAVSQDSPYHTLADLVKAAREKPGIITYGTPGVGTINHLPVELFQGVAKVKFQQVAYRGSPAVFTDIIGGHVVFVADPATGILPMIKSGKLRPLGVTSAQRSPLFPDVPTFEQQGFNGVIASAWFGMLAPAGTPGPVVDRLATELSKITAAPDMVKQYAEWGLTPLTETHEKFRDMIRSDLTKWGKVIQDIGGIKPD